MPDFIVCLEDGKELKMLKRHLAVHYNLTPAAYRQRWGLPADYPMVAPNYAEQRRTLARAYAKANRREDAERARETFARLNKMAEDAAQRGEQRGEVIEEKDTEKIKP